MPSYLMYGRTVTRKWCCIPTNLVCVLFISLCCWSENYILLISVKPFFFFTLLYNARSPPSSCRPGSHGFLPSWCWSCLDSSSTRCLGRRRRSMTDSLLTSCSTWTGISMATRRRAGNAGERWPSWVHRSLTSSRDFKGAVVYYVSHYWAKCSPYSSAKVFLQIYSTWKSHVYKQVMYNWQ